MKILYSLLFILFSLYAGAQCTPDSSITHNQPGFYPSASQGLPHAVAGQAYSTDIQFNVLTDTSLFGIPATVDSIYITNVAGLPSGFSYLCNPSDCTFPSGSNGCIHLQGTPASAMVGDYPLTVEYTVYGRVGGTPQSLAQTNEDYSITIDSTTGIGSIDRALFSVTQNNPNPAREITNILVTMMRPADVTVTVSNLLGKKIFSRVISLQRGKTNLPLDVRQFQSGIYLYTVSNGITTTTRRMIISND